MLNVKEVFDQAFTGIKIDANTAKALHKFRLGYVNQSRAYLEFFGSNLLGTHIIHFKDKDVARFFEIFNVDYLVLQNKIHQLSTMTHKHKVITEVVNLTCFYLIHRFMTAPGLSLQQREHGAYEAALIFYYRCMAALISAWIKYPADPKLAQAAYSNLSNKYLIKKLGSWHKVMDYRANDTINKKSVHHKTLIAFDDDIAVMYAISDGQNRIKDMIKNYYGELMKVDASGSVIGVTSSTMLDVDGEEVLKGKTSSPEASIDYLRNIIMDQHSFIRDDLVSVVTDIASNTSKRAVLNALNWLSEHYIDQKHHAEIDTFIRMVIIQSTYYIENQMRIQNRRDYPYILNSLKFLYLSSRSTDKDLIEIRKRGEVLMSAALKGSNNSLIMSTRTTIILYLTFRALVGKNAVA